MKVEGSVMTKSLWIGSGVGVLLVAVFFCICSPPALMGQSVSTGTITGTVTDPSGAAVAGATVTLTNLAKSTSRTATTNETGRYVLANVGAGTYTLKISKSG